MDNDAFGGKERRRFLRIDENVGMRYMVLDKNLAQIYETESKTQTQDIGGGGLKFLAAEELAPETLVELEFKLPDLTCPLVAIGKVLRTTEIVKDSEYEIAVSFIWVRKQDRDRIETHIKQKAD